MIDTVEIREDPSSRVWQCVFPAVGTLDSQSARSDLRGFCLEECR